MASYRATFKIVICAAFLLSASAKKACYIPLGSVKTPSKTVFKSGKDPNCAALCTVGQPGWNKVVRALSSEFLVKVSDKYKQCPKSGGSNAVMDFDGARRLIHVYTDSLQFVESSQLATYQYVVTKTLPDECRRACYAERDYVTIPAFNWAWGTDGAKLPLALACRKGYNKYSNACKDSVYVMEHKDRWFQTVCTAAKL